MNFPELRIAIVAGVITASGQEEKIHMTRHQCRFTSQVHSSDRSSSAICGQEDLMPS
jgi:hypothetical protein